MALRTIAFSCETCSGSFKITAARMEDVAFCPFCAEELVPVTDADDEDDIEDDLFNDDEDFE